MTPNSIQALLKLRGLKYEDVIERMKAHGVNCDKTELSKLINNHRASTKKQEAFAAALGMTREEIFDEEFYAVAALRRTA